MSRRSGPGPRPLLRARQALSRTLRLAVVGHIELVRFARVERVPAPGDIAHARETWEEAAGGGGVSVVQLARAAGSATMFTALGDDEAGHRAGRELEALGVRVEASFRDRPQRLAVTLIDADGERTITTFGERLDPSTDDPLPWDELASTDGVYVTAGDPGALEAARTARVVVATARILDRLKGLELDALVASARDPAEAFDPEGLKPAPRLAVLTEGGRGGTYRTADGTMGRFEAPALPGPMQDTYGAGDSFAAGLTYGLASGLGPQEAVDLAARWGGEALTRRGAHGA